MFVRHLVRQNCLRDIAIVIAKSYPPVWKWFVHKWIQCNENAQEFFTKYLPTYKKKAKIYE